MTFALISFGVFLIFVIFNVFESVIKPLNVNKKLLIGLLAITIVCYFIPNIYIFGAGFSLVGFFIPLVFSIIILARVKKLKEFSKMIVCSLIAFVFNIVYSLITFEVYESQILQPYIVLGVLLGFIGTFITTSSKNLFASNFIGIILSEIVFYFSRYSIFSEYFLTIGSLKVITTLFISFVFSLIVYFVKEKIKKSIIKKKLKKQERLNIM